MVSEPTDTSREAVNLLAIDFDTAAEISCFLSNAKYRQAASTLRALLARAEAAEARARESALQGLASLGQAAEAYDAQLKAEAERDALQAENARLRDALIMIERRQYHSGPAGTTAQSIARAALEAKP